MSMPEPPTRLLPPLRLHPEGWRFVGIFAAATALLFWLWAPLGWIGVILTLWCGYFFRDPERITPQDDRLVISPADGVVQMIAPVPPPAELEMGDAPLTRVSVFMNVFNVHVNRAPVAGTVIRRFYRPGLFLNAALDKASVDNERMSVRVQLANGADLAFVQIAGLVARRIRCDIDQGDRVAAGERFGLIRFGSRVDVYLPPGAVPLVIEGQTCIAGETVLADLTGGASRTGVRR